MEQIVELNKTDNRSKSESWTSLVSIIKFRQLKTLFPSCLALAIAIYWFLVKPISLSKRAHTGAIYEKKRKKKRKSSHDKHIALISSNKSTTANHDLKWTDISIMETLCVVRQMVHRHTDRSSERKPNRAENTHIPFSSLPWLVCGLPRVWFVASLPFP